VLGKLSLVQLIELNRDKVSVESLITELSSLSEAATRPGFPAVADID
jgi:hypothetical protein